MSVEEKVKIDIDLDAQKLSAGVKESVSRIEALEKQLKDLEKTGESTGTGISNKLQDMSKGFDTLATAGKKMTTAVTLPLVGFATASVKTAADFEYAMSEVQAISGATGTELNRLTEHAKTLGRETFFSSQEAAEGMKYFALAGFDTNQILQVMRPTLDLATASGMSLSKACDIISDNVSALGLEVSETTMLVDQMAATSSNSNTTIEMMGEAFKYVAPLANTLGINTVDLSAAIGLLGDNGLRAGQAGNILKTGLARLSAPTTQMQKTMDKYNISLQKNEDGSVNLMGTVAHLREKIGHLDKTTQAQVISTLMGKEALSGWAALINTSQERVDELSSKIENSNGKAEEMAKIMGDNLKGSINAMKSAFEGVMITVGDMFIPILKNVVDSVTGVLRKFNEMDSGTQKLVVSIGTAVAAIGPLMMAIGGIGGAITKVIPLLSSIASGFGVTLSASTALIGGLTSLGIAFVGLLGWMGSSSEMISYLQTKFGAFGEFFAGLGEMIYGVTQLTFGNLGILLGTIGDALVALVTGKWHKIGSIWKDGTAKMSTNTKEAMSNIKMETTNATKAMRQMSSSQLQGMTSDFSNFMGLLKNTTAENVGEMAGKFTEGISGMSNESLSILRGSSDTFAMLFEGIYENMSNERKTEMFTNNLNAMVRAGALDLATLEKDFENFNKMVDLNMKDGANQISHNGETLWKNFKDVSTRGIGEVSLAVATDIKKMDADTFNILQGMGGSWGQVFEGITDITSMSTSEIASIIESNYSNMGMTSEQIMTAMEQDMQMYIASQQLANTTLSESNQKMVADMGSIYESLSTTTTDNVNQIANNVMTTVDGMALGSLEKLKGMGDGFGQVFKGIEEDGSMSSEQMRAKVVENLTAMMEQGLPIGELLKTDMISFLQSMANEGGIITEGFTTNVTSEMASLTGDVSSSLSPLPAEVQSALSATGNTAMEGATTIKQNIASGVEGTSTEVMAKLDAVPTAVQGKVQEASLAANEAQQIKSNIVQQVSGTNAEVQANMSAIPTTVSGAMNQATSAATSGSANIKNAVNNGTKVDTVVNTNLNNANTAVSNQTKKMAKTAETEARNISKGINNGTKDVAKSADTNFKALERSVKNSMSNASKIARQQATNMYTGVRTSFTQMNSQGTASANSLKNNVINATATMKNSAIRFWSQIRNEYAKTIKGRIEVTKVMKEEKIVTVTTTKKEAPASIASKMAEAFSLDEAELIGRQTAVATLSRLRDNDTINVKEEKKKGKTTKYKNTNNTGESKTYITNNYTSPKATSLLELKRQAKRESRKLGVSFK